jgi:hypothetical protein
MTVKVSDPSKIRPGALLRSPTGTYFVLLDHLSETKSEVVNLSFPEMRSYEGIAGWGLPDLLDVPSPILATWETWYNEITGVGPKLPETCKPTQVGGDHYTKMPEGYQPFDISHKLGLNPVEHSILKYLLRHRSKNGKQDLLKIKHCVDILIEQEYPND